MSTGPTPAPDAVATVPVEVLTDEELSVVARPGPMPVLPFLDALAPEVREVARRTAYRSLLARGIVDPPSPDSIAAATALADGSVELLVRQDVQSVVLLREGAQVVVAAARTTAAGQDFWYAHVVDDVVLVEEVSSDGLHRFALADAATLGDLVTAAVVHPDAGDGTGPAIEVDAEVGDPTPPDLVLERLGAAFVRADVIVRRPGDTDPPTFALFSGPQGCWVVDATRPPASAVAITATAAAALVARSVAAVLAEARVLGG